MAITRDGCRVRTGDTVHLIVHAPEPRVITHVNVEVRENRCYKGTSYIGHASFMYLNKTVATIAARDRLKIMIEVKLDEVKPLQQLLQDYDNEIQRLTAGVDSSLGDCSGQS